jgi:hypothetical protein
MLRAEVGDSFRSCLKSSFVSPTSASPAKLLLHRVALLDLIVEFFERGPAKVLKILLDFDFDIVARELAAQLSRWSANSSDTADKNMRTDSATTPPLMRGKAYPRTGSRAISFSKLVAKEGLPC